MKWFGKIVINACFNLKKIFFSLSLLAERLSCLNSEDWSQFLQQVCGVLESVDRAGSANATAPRTKLNLLCYLCTVCNHRETATRLIHSPLVRCIWNPSNLCDNVQSHGHYHQKPWQDDQASCITLILCHTERVNFVTMTSWLISTQLPTE